MTKKKSKIENVSVPYLNEIMCEAKSKNRVNPCDTKSENNSTIYIRTKRFYFCEEQKCTSKREKCQDSTSVLFLENLSENVTRSENNAETLKLQKPSNESEVIAQ